MPDCRACGHPNILWGETAEGQRVPLEPGIALDGPDRYRIIEYGTPSRIAPVKPSYALEAYPDHRQRCPRR